MQSANNHILCKALDRCWEIPRFQNDIWLCGSFDYFHCPHPLPYPNSWYCWSALHPDDNITFLSAPRRCGRIKTAASGSLLVKQKRQWKGIEEWIDQKIIVKRKATAWRCLTWIKCNSKCAYKMWNWHVGLQAILVLNMF